MLILVNDGSATQIEGVKLNWIWQEAVSSRPNNTEFLSEDHALAQDFYFIQDEEIMAYSCIM